MFRFLSGRKTKRPSTTTDGGGGGGTKSAHHKNRIQCRVILLDGTDLSVELSVSFVVTMVGVFAICYTIIIV